MTELPDPNAYLLQGVVEEKDEDGEWYSNRELVLSFEPDDAGNINMDISDAAPLFELDQILYLIRKSETLEELRQRFEGEL